MLFSWFCRVCVVHWNTNPTVFDKFSCSNLNFWTQFVSHGFCWLSPGFPWFLLVQIAGGVASSTFEVGWGNPSGSGRSPGHAIGPVGDNPAVPATISGASSSAQGFWLQNSPGPPKWSKLSSDDVDLLLQQKSYQSIAEYGPTIAQHHDISGYKSTPNCFSQQTTNMFWLEYRHD